MNALQRKVTFALDISIEKKQKQKKKQEHRKYGTFRNLLEH